MNQLVCCHVNCRSLLAQSDFKVSRLDLLNSFCSIDNSIDVVALTETHLDGTISDDEVCINDLSLFRRDRVIRGRSGGGVALYIKNSLQPIKVNIDTGSNECLFVQVQADSKKMIIGVTYRPPNQTSTESNQLLKLFQTMLII